MNNFDSGELKRLLHKAGKYGGPLHANYWRSGDGMFADIFSGDTCVAIAYAENFADLLMYLHEWAEDFVLLGSALEDAQDKIAELEEALLEAKECAEETK